MRLMEERDEKWRAIHSGTSILYLHALIGQL